MNRTWSGVTLLFEPPSSYDEKLLMLVYEQHHLGSRDNVSEVDSEKTKWF